MDPTMAEGLRIMAVGILGVFANLMILMLMVNLMGATLGKRKNKPGKEAAKSAGGAA